MNKKYKLKKTITWYDEQLSNDNIRIFCDGYFECLDFVEKKIVPKSNGINDYKKNCIYDNHRAFYYHEIHYHLLNCMMFYSMTLNLTYDFNAKNLKSTGGDFYMAKNNLTSGFEYTDIYEGFNRKFFIDYAYTMYKSELYFPKITKVKK